MQRGRACSGGGHDRGLPQDREGSRAAQAAQRGAPDAVRWLPRAPGSSRGNSHENRRTLGGFYSSKARVAGVPLRSNTTTTTMGASDELDYLKTLVSQLNEKIKALEVKASASAPRSPVQQLRTILVGPPGAGTWRVRCGGTLLTFL